jgi:integrase
VSYIRAVLRSALSQAVVDGLVQRNVAALAKPPRIPRSEVRSLTPDEATALLTTARGDRLWALWVIALSLGLRRSELLGLMWAGVDLEHGTVRVSRGVQRVGGQLVLDELKSASSHRTLPLPRVAGRALKEHRTRQAAERLHIGRAWADLDLVFCTEIGTPLDPRNLNRSFRSLLIRAGVGVVLVEKDGETRWVTRVRLHDLRHSCASFLLAQGASPRVVMEILGHSGIAVTMNTYAHVLPTLLGDAVAGMDRMLGEPPEVDGDN